MDEERQVGAGEMRSRSTELGFVYERENIDAGGGEEAFEAADAGAGEGLNVGSVVIGDAAPCGPVNEAVALGGGTFGFERGYAGGGGEAVERHVDEGGVTAGGCGACSCGEAFPGA